MIRCKKCILNENFPGITFDENGVCSFCNKSQDTDLKQHIIMKHQDKFKELISQYKRKCNYDCIVAYSGGKDSSYTLHLLKNEYKLNILAFTFDNWYQSDFAKKNIRQVVKKLNVDLIDFTPNFEIWKNILNIVKESNFYSTKHIQRASDICTTCISLIRFSILKIAIQKDIPFIIFGMSPGQSPPASSIFKTNSSILAKMQSIIKDPLERKLGKKVSPYFLSESDFQKTSFPYIINPLSFLEYNEEKIYGILKDYGWTHPQDTDSCSTNCLLNSLGNQIHLDNYGFHPYSFEVSEMVRFGILERNNALELIEKKQNEKIIKLIMNELKV